MVSKIRERVLFLLLLAASFDLYVIDQVEWTDPKYNHQN